MGRASLDLATLGSLLPTVDPFYRWSGGIRAIRWRRNRLVRRFVDTRRDMGLPNPLEDGYRPMLISDFVTPMVVNWPGERELLPSTGRYRH